MAKDWLKGKRAARVTQENVAIAIKDLQAVGRKPTLRNVRLVLGAGSFDTIGKMIQAHFDSNPSDSSTEVLFKRIADLQTKLAHDKSKADLNQFSDLLELRELWLDATAIIQSQKIKIENDLAANGDFSLAIWARDQAIKKADQYQQVLIAMGDGYGKAIGELQELTELRELWLDAVNKLRGNKYALTNYKCRDHVNGLNMAHLRGEVQVIRWDRDNQVKFKESLQAKVYELDRQVTELLDQVHYEKSRASDTTARFNEFEKQNQVLTAALENAQNERDSYKKIKGPGSNNWGQSKINVIQ